MKQAKVMRYKEGIASKILTRTLWHFAFREGFPVRLRVTNKVLQPTFRFNGRHLTIWLPPELARLLPTLARWVRALRTRRKCPKRGGNGHKRLCSVKELAQPDPISPTNGRENTPPNNPPSPKPAKANGKAKPKGQEPSQPLITVACLCGRRMEVPNEWLSAGIVRCQACGRFL